MTRLKTAARETSGLGLICLGSQVVGGTHTFDRRFVNKNY